MSTSYVPTAGGATGIAAETVRLREQARSTGAAELQLIEQYRVEQGISTPPYAVLDLGGGTGAFSDIMARYWSSAEVVCADLSPEFLSQANVSRLHLGSESLPNEHFDLVVVRHVLQHLESEAAATLLKKAEDALTEGGALIIVDVDDADWGTVHPAFPSLGAIHARIARDQLSRGGNRCGLDLLQKRLTEIGFDHVSRLRETVSSTDVGLDALDVHIRPDRWARQVATGAINLDDLALLTAAYRRWRAAPDASLSINIHILAARKPCNSREISTN